VQCFDAGELKRVRRELDCDLKLIQLIGENSWAESDTDYEQLKTARGLRELASVADGVGPWIGQLYALADIDDQPVSTGVTKFAHDAGLAVHPYTFRADAVPPGFGSYAELVHWFVGDLKIDGLFTDFTDLTVRILSN
jgi:glycerophosphoryl diester phosphodiesterase